MKSRVLQLQVMKLLSGSWTGHMHKYHLKAEWKGTAWLTHLDCFQGVAKLVHIKTEKTGSLGEMLTGLIIIDNILI